LPGLVPGFFLSKKKGAGGDPLREFAKTPAVQRKNGLSARFSCENIGLYQYG
jgi:hypothetical protein